MIPFKLFKYIYFRNVIYGFVITTLIVAIMTFLSLSFANALKESNLLSIISVLISILITLLANKFILNKLLFKKYKRIVINTDLKSVSIKFTVLFILMTRITVSIPYFGFLKMFSILCENNQTLLSISFILCSIVYILAEYYVINSFFGKYITVSEKTEEQ